MAYGKYKMGSKRTITGPATPGSGDGEGTRFYAGGPGFRELNNLGPKTPGGRVTIMPVKPKPDKGRKPKPGKTLIDTMLPGKPGSVKMPLPIRRKGPGGGPKPRKPIISRKERQLPTRVKPQGQRRKASDMGKTAQNGRSRIRGGR